MGFLFGNKEELERKIEELTGEIAGLNKAVASKNTTITTLKDENNGLKAEMTRELDRQATLGKQIEILGNELKEKDELLEALKAEAEELKAKSLSGRQMEIVEKNLKDNQRIIADYKAETERLGNQIRGLENENRRLTELLSINGLSAGDPDRRRFTYKIPLEIFFPIKEYQEIIDKLHETGIFFVQDIGGILGSEAMAGARKQPEAAKKVQNFEKGRMSWQVRTTLVKGEPITTVFKKKKKFSQYLAEQGLEFMDELADFDWTALQNTSFTGSQMREFQETAEEYFRNNTIG